MEMVQKSFTRIGHILLMTRLYSDIFPGKSDIVSTTPQGGMISHFSSLSDMMIVLLLKSDITSSRWHGGMKSVSGAVFF